MNVLRAGYRTFFMIVEIIKNLRKINGVKVGVVRRKPNKPETFNSGKNLSSSCVIFLEAG